MENTKLDTKMLLEGASFPLIALRRKIAQKKEAEKSKKDSRFLNPSLPLLNAVKEFRFAVRRRRQPRMELD